MTCEEAGSMALTASRLRENIYKILDKVIDTGIPVEIERRGKKLRILPVESGTVSKLDNLTERPDTILCDPEEIVHIDWSGEWRP
jgi:hypothetical protein